MTTTVLYQASLRETTYRILAHYHNDDLQLAEVVVSTPQCTEFTLYFSATIEGAKNFLKDEINNRIKSDMDYNY